MVTIRMYNVGLGDCFLLRFEGKAKPWFMLIDCGLFRGSPAERETLNAVVDDIAQTTHGRLDVVVATHEHQDHLSGFWYAQESFRAQIQIGQVWLAWTENPADPMANALKATMNGFAEQLEQTMTQLRHDPRRGISPDTLAAVESVLEFAGFGEPLAANDRLSINQKALRFLKEAPTDPEQPVLYVEPGSMAPVAALPNVRFFVLGPPRSELLRKSDPTRSRPEVYHFAGGERSNYALLIPATDKTNTDPDRQDAIPFDSSYQMSITDAQNDPFFCNRYWNDTDPAGTDQRYRRIDNDWLYAVGDLALQLDGDTNNTSLALAIELVDSGRVLLFPGDAQVGNWLSWDSCKWTDFPNLTTQQLLAKTVFYKVGHHGSHNATLREQGLERMTHPDLVAMIPVDETFARQKKKWDMPFGGLYKRLVEKTRGRVIQADGHTPPLPDPRYPSVTDATEQQAFLKALRHSPSNRPGAAWPLWTEYTIG
ncbi:hypothetical protein F5984_17455 [Rudanella paleaurantiibacter]|uniref:Metallo-beta-lactamase domain-containing protein n=1 Tax=Rudanella paleaurantiibacter TaxID=2614655 RepID=A0A7J5TY26_9BACT|nr:MBL fold metallo-hydrolase [Rudanella paleaurantiibacter]KAB7728628.1 hypothetical protein F5984_17455 [Rudanella paleaurantiibacter]